MNELILQTAHKLFTTQGIQPFTMEELASRMAISKKTLYRFFDSRQHLVQEVCQRVANHQHSTTEAVDQTALNSLEKVLGYMAANISFCKKNNPAFFADLQKHYPVEYTKLIASLHNTIYQRLVNALEEGIVEGVFRGSLHPSLVVSILWQHIQKDFEFAAELVNEYSKDEVFRQAMYLFLYGIIAPDAIPQLEHQLQQYSHSIGIVKPKQTDLY
jgi:AcrR family transcriptional regulator